MGKNNIVEEDIQFADEEGVADESSINGIPKEERILVARLTTKALAMS